MQIRSKIFERGHENESDVISDYGTGERGVVYKYSKVAKKCLPLDEARALDRDEADDHRLAVVAHGYISDEMPPTKNPLNPREIYTSKSKLRAVYKAAGAEEIGTAYDNGYRPEKIQEERTRQFEQRIHEAFKERLNR